MHTGGVRNNFDSPHYLGQVQSQRVNRVEGFPTISSVMVPAGHFILLTVCTFSTRSDHDTIAQSGNVADPQTNGVGSASFGALATALEEAAADVVK